jgi:hypothetical protein
MEFMNLSVGPRQTMPFVSSSNDIIGSCGCLVITLVARFVVMLKDHGCLWSVYIW